LPASKADAIAVARGEQQGEPFGLQPWRATNNSALAEASSSQWASSAITRTGRSWRRRRAG
jgi:hypothetical protein